MTGDRDRPLGRRTWIAFAALLGIAVVALVVAWRPRSVWLRRDAEVVAAEAWAAKNVTTRTGPGGVVTITSSGGIRSHALGFTYAPPAPGALPIATPFALSLSPTDGMTVCTGAPGGPALPPIAVAGLGMDGKELFLVEEQQWRRLLARIAPKFVRSGAYTRYVAGERRTIDGVEWREYRAASAFSSDRGPALLLQVGPTR